MSPVSMANRSEWSQRLAQSLVSGGYATSAVLDPLLAEAQASGQSLGSLLISRQITVPNVVVGTLAQASQLPAVDLSAVPLDPNARGAVPPGVAQEYGIVGLRVDGNQLAVAFGEPPTPEDVRALSAIVGYRVNPVIADPIMIQHLVAADVAAAAGTALSEGEPAPGGLAQGYVSDDRSGNGHAGSGYAANGSGYGSGNGHSGSGNGNGHSGSGNGNGHSGSGNGNGHSGSGNGNGNGHSAVATQASRPPASQLAAEPAAPESAPLHIDDLLRYAVSVGASDLHLTAQMPACIRLHGAVRPIEGCPKLSNETIREMVFGILPASQRERFEAERELDTSHSIAGVGRFRVNVSLQRGTVAAALRPIPHEMPLFESLGIPDSIRAFTDLRRGLVLVTGPTGSGKSTTLASMVDIINRTKPLHIVTVEDPIEFLHEHKRSIIDQREVGEDTFSFAEALRRVLRQDPDVILVGELRDLETISMALTAAETGHLVFATLHTQDAPQTIDRIIDVFPTNQQEQIRVMLASTLEGVVTQQLILNADGTGRVACCEVLVCTSGVRNLVRSAKTHQIYSLMQTGSMYGMQTMDQGLARLVRDGVITESVAYDRSRNEDDLRNHLNS